MAFEDHIAEEPIRCQWAEQCWEYDGHAGPHQYGATRSIPADHPALVAAMEALEWHIRCHAHEWTVVEVEETTAVLSDLRAAMRNT